MADIRSAFNDLAWFQYGSGDQGSGHLATPCVYASATSFTIAGINVIAAFHVGRQVRAVGSSTGTIYGTITASTFSTNTTVTVQWLEGSLSNETLVISLSQFPIIGGPVPFPYIDFRATGADQTGATSASTKFQAAIDSGNAAIDITDGLYAFDKAVIIKSGTSRVTIGSHNRIRSVLMANAADLSTGTAHGINTMFIVQDNNAHFCLHDAYQAFNAAFTGHLVYALEGGGTDGLGQAAFSGIFRDLFISPGQTAASSFYGGYQNCQFRDITMENQKGLLQLAGLGTGDCKIQNVSALNCYDEIVRQADDTNGAFQMSVAHVNAYSHKRGRLIYVKNWNGGNFHDFTLEPETTANGNVGDLGLFRLKDCAGVTATQFYALTRVGVQQCDVGIELDTTSGKFIGGAIDGVIGLKISGTGAIDVDVIGVDFINGGTTAVHSIIANCTGELRTRGCKFNNAQNCCVLDSAANALAWVSEGDQFLNAGLAGTAGSRNISVDRSADITMYRPRIGQNNVSAAAGFYIAANGVGNFDIYDPIWVGTPPIGYVTGSQTVRFHYTNSGSYTVAGLPSAGFVGRTAFVSNESGGAVLAFDDGTNWRRVTDRAIVS